MDELALCLWINQLSLMERGDYYLIRYPSVIFFLPYSLVPIYLQAVFFKIGGINWFCYCFHAAIFNGLFSIIVFLILNFYGAPLLISLVIALLSALVFYPPFGVPYMDQHSWFFSLLALFSAIIISRASTSLARIVLASLSSLFILAAYLSKSIPALFFLPVIILAILISLPKASWKISFLSFASSLILFVLLILALFNLKDVLPAQIVEALVFIPSRLSKERIAFFSSYYSLPEFLTGLFYPKPFNPLCLRLYSHYLIYISLIFFLLIMVSQVIKLKISFYSFVKKNRDLIFMSLLSPTLLIISNLFIFLTLNQGENSLAVLFLSSALMYLSLLRLGPLGVKGNRFPFKIIVTFIFILFSLFDGPSYNQKVNRQRIVHDMFVNPKELPWDVQMPDGLQFMRFAAPPKYGFNATNLKNVVEFLRKEKANFFLLGDSSILYGLTRRPSLNPALWFHPGLCIPLLDSPAFAEYEEKFLQNLKRYRAKYLIIEGPLTWFDLYLEKFKKLPLIIIVSEVAKNRRFGPFRIYRIDVDRIARLQTLN